jgi:hypothetical protein
MDDHRKDWFEIAVRMFDREHDRWNSWAIFFFGSIASVFVVSDQTGGAGCRFGSPPSPRALERYVGRCSAEYPGEHARVAADSATARSG